MPELVLPSDAERIMRPGSFFSLENVAAALPGLSFDHRVVEALQEVPFSRSLLGRCAKTHLLFPVLPCGGAIRAALQAAKKRGVTYASHLHPYREHPEPPLPVARWCLLAMRPQPPFRRVRNFAGQVRELPPSTRIASLTAVSMALLLQHRAPKVEKGRRLPLSPKGRNLVTSTRTTRGHYLTVTVGGGPAQMDITVAPSSSEGDLPDGEGFPLEQAPSTTAQPQGDWLLLQNDAG